ncbi:MAG TPA: glycosyltransferase family 2 protein [Bryobacteraceae bacterium]|nr:glycosyltransferase family 2 protein [Bryobacteraceae bacterium]
MNRIGVVVVAYNSEREIGRCLDSLPESVETVVVDNASQDGTRREVASRPSVKLIANPWNRGFAAGANQGIGALDCDLVLLLNPDVELVSALDALVSQFDAPGVAAAGGRLLASDGSSQAGFMVRRLPTPWTLVFETLGLNRLWRGNPVNRRYRCFDLDPDVEATVEQPAGAFLMIRRTVWRQLGGFDESFFPVWFEDVDFAKRAAMAGHRIRYSPRTVAKHSGGHSVGQLPRSTRDLYWCGSLLEYTFKHFARAEAMAICASVVAGSLLRAVIAPFRGKPLEGIISCVRMIRLAGVLLLSGQTGIRTFRRPLRYSRMARP